jgi:hypothetical protein
MSALVDRLNAWGAATYPDTGHELFLRVIWGEDKGNRHPDVPNGQVPYGPVIPLRDWGPE